MRKSLMLTVAAASLLTAASSACGAGTWVPANVPLGGSNFTMFGINDKNVVTGDYTDSSGNIQGVIGPFDGSSYTSFTDGGTSTQPRGIGPTGIITGFDTGTLYPWERSTKGKLKNITLDGNPVTGVAQQVNKSGVFVGDHANASGIGPAIGRKYRWTKVIKLKICNTGCAGRAIDDAGDTGGYYSDNSGIQHGFVNIVGQKPIKVDYPNAHYTVVEGMNNKGTVSGQWEDVSGVIHGFIYNINKKTYTSLDAPGASFTQVWGLNDAGVVAASAAEPSGTESFAYCMHSAGCPSAGAAVERQHRRPGKAVPQSN
jgi:hypothetical protein